MDDLVIFNYVLPIWYPLVVLGIFFVLLFLHKNNFKFIGYKQIDRIVTVLGFILLFGSELLYFLCPHEGGSFFYYMDPDVVGWLVAIIAFLMTFIVIIGQFFWYLDFIPDLHDRSYSYISNLIVMLLIIVLLVMKILGICDEFLDEYMLHLLIGIIGIHIIIIMVQNIQENTGYMILLEVPLFLLSILAFLLSSVVTVFLLLVSLLPGKSDSSYSSSSSESPSPKSCEDCHHYDISGRYCRYYKEKKDPYTTGNGAIYDASSCPELRRR